MAEVFPFKGLFYDPSRVQTSDVIIPPYDNIRENEIEKYRKRSPYSLIHAILPADASDDYTRQALLLKKWREVGVLKEETAPHFYLYRQQFSYQEKIYERDALMCTVTLTPFGSGPVLPHEQTHGKFKDDRLQILQKTGHNLSHVFGAIQDEEDWLKNIYSEFAFQKPMLSGRTDEGVEHFLWALPQKHNGPIREFLANKNIYIIDGHHRYSAALKNAEIAGALGQTDRPESQMLFALVNTLDPALVVLPTHRCLYGPTPAEFSWNNIETEFDLRKMDEAALERFVDVPAKTPQFAVYAKNEVYLCEPKSTERATQQAGASVASLGVYWSDQHLLKNYCSVDDHNRSTKIHYLHDWKEAWDTRKEYGLTVFHARPSVAQVTRIADDGRFMPQKSTFFYPKLAAGLLLRRL